MELSEKKSRPIAAKLNHWTSMDFNLWQRRNGCFFENSHCRIFEIQLVFNWHTGAGKPRVCNPKSSVVIFFTHLTLTRTLIAEAIGGEFEIKHRNQIEELRPWIFGRDFGDSGVPFWRLIVHPGASRRQKSILEVLTDLGAQNESSGACLRDINANVCACSECIGKQTH